MEPVSGQLAPLPPGRYGWGMGNLAGVPSIVYGILGLALFVRIMGLGRGVLAGALTLSLLSMPMITLAAM